MAKVLEITDGIYQIEPEGIEKGIPSMVYFIDDDKKTLIETGSASQIPQVLEALQTMGEDVSSLSYIIPTHIHIDHAGGCGTLTKYTPNAQVIAHPRGVNHMIDPRKLIKGIRMAFGDNFEEEFGPILPVPQSMIHVAQDEETIHLGTRDLKIIHSEGHAPHHICIFDSKSKGLFSGDELGLYLPETNTFLLAVAPPFFALDKNLRSINRIRELSPKLLLFSQFGVTWNVLDTLDYLENTNKAMGEIVLKGLISGEDRNLIQEKLSPYLKGAENIRYRLLKELCGIDGIISPLEAYFKNKGMI